MRAAGAFHGLAREGRCDSLSALYPALHATNEQPDDPSRAALPTADELWRAIEIALIEQPFLCAYLDGPPQTNEVARSSALLGAALHLVRQSGLALEWHEIGTSAGLNLLFDHYRYNLVVGSYGDGTSDVTIDSDWQGNAPSLVVPLSVIARAGCDINPLEPGVVAHRERLLSYVWPDQRARLQRTMAALQHLARSDVRVERARASTWVAQRFASPPKRGTTRVLAHTVVWQYLARAERDAISETMRRAGEQARDDARLAWISMEADELREGASLQLITWPGPEKVELARADFHGRWVRWS